MISMRHLPWAAALAFFSVGCSLINKPDAIKAGPGSSGGAGGSASTTTGGGAPPGCTIDADCKSLTTGCAIGTCDTAQGTCATKNAPAGTACGEATSGDCDAADTCDDSGKCVTNNAADGTYCSDCAAGPGKCTLCSAGACSDCSSRAKTKTFRTPLSASGWQFTGGWGIYEQTPPSAPPYNDPPFVFDTPVFGTDGNRVHPYPGRETEQSSAISPPFLIPAQLIFKSWSWDEGGGFNGPSPYDQKTISISVDGGASFTTVAFCGGPTNYDFCIPFDGTWRDIALDLTAANGNLVGQIGLVKFGYDTGDSATGRERGWFIDQLNFATDCACQTDDQCAYATATCATGTCDHTQNECSLSPKPLGNACGSSVNDTCSGPDTCDKNGFCNINYESKEAAVCQNCTDGMGECFECGGGVCLNCPALQTFDTFPDTTGWVFTGGWGLYTQPPPQSQPPATSTPFGAPHQYALGVDGTPVSPYWTFNGSFYVHDTAVEKSSFTTPPTVIPATLTFDSWNVDRGGHNGHDEKRIRVTTDNGITYTTLLDCQGLNQTQPMCTAVSTRAPTDWDAITIDTGALAGKTGVFEFDYDSLDAGTGQEQGWYIDNINILRCNTY